MIRKLCDLKKEIYPDFSMRHFYEYATEKHGLKISYNWARLVLEEAKIVEKAPGRGKHRRQRERRPMTGMLIPIDGSTHTWIQGLPQQDLILVLDDGDGRVLHGQFVPQEGTLSTMAALEHVLVRYGRFCELYHDCGSHFGHTSHAGQGPDEEQNGQVTRVLKTLGIRQIFARSRVFLPFVALRAERLFGIPRDKAQARILGRRRPLSTIPPDEESELKLEEQGHPVDDFLEIQETLKKVGT